MKKSVFRFLHDLHESLDRIHNFPSICFKILVTNEQVPQNHLVDNFFLSSLPTNKKKTNKK